MDTTDRILLDLAWLATAEPLMEDAFWQLRGVRPARQPPHCPPGDLAPRGRAVGRWFEQLHAHAVSQTPDLEILAVNLPIQGDDRTLGELDLLYRSGEHVVHREIAVKYYLAVEPGNARSAWWGLNRRDRLDRKLDRMLDHQLSLSSRAGTAWPEHLPRPTLHEVLLTGALFARTARLPDGANPQVEQGRWLYASELAQLDPDSSWHELPRPWWLSPRQPGESPTTPRELARCVTSRQRPALVRQAEGPMQRMFVVPDGWWSGDAL